MLMHYKCKSFLRYSLKVLNFLGSLLIHEEYASISFISELDSMASGDVTFGESMDGIADDV